MLAAGPPGIVSCDGENGYVASRRVRRNRSILAALVLLGGALWWFFSCAPRDALPSLAQPEPFAPPIALPPAAAGLSSDNLAYDPLATLADPTWLKNTSAATGIPERALAAYAGVALGQSVVRPGCNLSWNTLAAIGWVESHHGTIFGGKLLDDGTMNEPIYGIPLDGTNNTQKLPDFDDGNFDGTAEFDRAVGPMQIIPPTWAAWHSDGNSDGIEDGQNIDDSVLAAGRYLCFSGGDLSTTEGWNKAIYSYNQSSKYIKDVANKANEYARAAEGG